VLVLIEQHELINDNSPKASSCERCKPFTSIWVRHSKTFLNKPLNGSAACRKATLLIEERTQLLREKVILVEKGQQGTGCVEAANNHDD
jgi:hypothetical protein